MLAKLMLMLSASKGAVVAAVVVLGASTITVGAASPEVQDAVSSVVQTVTGHPGDTAKTFRNDCGHGQPAVVAQRNAATKLLGAAFQRDQKALEGLRGKGVENKAAGDLIKTADDQLKAIRATARNAVAALTLGRDGQNTPSGSASPKPSTSPAPSASASPCPSASPEASESPEPSGSAQPEGSAKPSEQGRVTVALRTTLDPGLTAIVDQAIADMDALVKDTTAKVAALPAPRHGKPSDQPGGKPSDHPGGKPSDVPGGKKP
ncbi:MAG TPA: hypothetical protein VGT60_04740 [Candidatus Limnocylindria bacterium]|nr:hypothetical protein [Candidatus Limnocylindria bacterium]